MQKVSPLRQGGAIMSHQLYLSLTREMPFRQVRLNTYIPTRAPDFSVSNNIPFRTTTATPDDFVSQPLPPSPPPPIVYTSRATVDTLDNKHHRTSSQPRTDGIVWIIKRPRPH